MNPYTAPVASIATAPSRLVVFDDIFPHPLSSFRFAEFTGLLDAFPNASVHTSGSVLPSIAPGLEISELIKSHVNIFPEHRDRIQAFHPGASLAGKTAYCVFFHNICSILEVLNRDKTPFVFTLYPGGGFYLNESHTDESLKRVFASPNFRTVIATQPLTRNYLIDKGLCDTERIQFIFGGVLPPPNLLSLPEKQFYGIHKKTVDVCFAAWRYMPLGRDKGYDTFVLVAKRLARRFDAVHFHVVGPWDEKEIDVSVLAERIHFHPPMSSTDLKVFFRRMDLIVSPNRPFTLTPGKFDGFPSGCCVEAGLSGVAVCATDELKQNGPFTNGRDILITSVGAEEIAEVVGNAISDYDGLTELANKGQAAFSQVFGWTTQMGPRLEVLSRLQSLPVAAQVPAPRPVPPLPDLTVPANHASGV